VPTGVNRSADTGLFKSGVPHTKNLKHLLEGCLLIFGEVVGDLGGDLDYLGGRSSCDDIDHVLLQGSHVTEHELLSAADLLSQDLIDAEGACRAVRRGTVIVDGVVGCLPSISCLKETFFRVNAVG